MAATDIHEALRLIFAELTGGATEIGSGHILNSGDVGLLRSLDTLTAGDASEAVNGGATIAAHAQHLRYGLSLMNQWAVEGGNPLANPRWDEAWAVSTVDERQWLAIRNGLTDEAHRWLDTLGSPRTLTVSELTEMIGSIAHVAYHLGAIRQIARSARGPTEGTFT